MKPLIERIKGFPADQFVDWLCLACVDVREVRTPDDAQEEIDKIRGAVTERLAALEQRAEAAEAKLAEMQRQEPVAYRWEGKKSGSICYDGIMPLGIICQPLFIRPAPAINLAQPVPDGWQLVPVEPTKEMLSAALKFPAQTRKQYASMLAAAPKPFTD